MIKLMSNRNLIILGGGLLIIIFFITITMWNNRSMVSQPESMQQNGDYMMTGGSEEMSVLLSAQSDSEESGVANLKETNGGTIVDIFVAGYEAGVSQPAHVHMGVCPGVGEVVYPLNPVLDGRSTTMLDVSMAQLMQQLPLAINIHKSSDEISVYTSCGAL